MRACVDASKKKSEDEGRGVTHVCDPGPGPGPESLALVPLLGFGGVACAGLEGVMLGQYVVVD